MLLVHSVGLHMFYSQERQQRVAHGTQYMSLTLGAAVTYGLLRASMLPGRRALPPAAELVLGGCLADPITSNQYCLPVWTLVVQTDWAAEHTYPSLTVCESYTLVSLQGRHMRCAPRAACGMMLLIS